mmetsp:Transcript_12549/g.53761  ORF Transcript_12549/g.53761 Transcript_12549/m.53761 type:complete len:234 (-) Transcript_12549:626-1327(-)
MPRSPMISSEPPRMAPNLTLRWNRSTTCPIPVAVMARPPKIWHASSATSFATRVAKSFRSAIGPASFAACSTCDMCCIWNVIASSQAWTPSTWLASLASFCRITGCSAKGFPKTILCFDHFRHSSMISLDARLTPATMYHRSWLKLCMMYLNPWFSTPTRLETGTRTSSNVTYVVPDAQTPMQSMRLQLTPGIVFSTTSSDMPPMPGPPVRTATVKKSAHTPLVIHFFSPDTT